MPEQKARQTIHVRVNNTQINMTKTLSKVLDSEFLFSWVVQ